MTSCPAAQHSIEICSNNQTCNWPGRISRPRPGLSKVLLVLFVKLTWDRVKYWVWLLCQLSSRLTLSQLTRHRNIMLVISYSMYMYSYHSDSRLSLKWLVNCFNLNHRPEYFPRCDGVMIFIWKISGVWGVRWIRFTSGKVLSGVSSPAITLQLWPVCSSRSVSVWPKISVEKAMMQCCLNSPAIRL